MTAAGTFICDPDVCAHAPTPSVPRMSALRVLLHGHGHCWHESTARRIAQQGGPSANAAADLAAWQRLGHRQERAA